MQQPSGFLIFYFSFICSDAQLALNHSDEVFISNSYSLAPIMLLFSFFDCYTLMPIYLQRVEAISEFNVFYPYQPSKGTPADDNDG